MKTHQVPVALSLAIAALFLGVNKDAVAENYPSKPIRVIVPLAPGSGTDLAARAIGQELSKRVGQPVVIENRTGAGGVVGVEAASRAAPDGYTVVIGSSTTMAANLFLYKNLSFDPLADFEPIAMVGTMGFAMLVPSSLDVKNVSELVSLAKANPGQLSYGYGSSAALLCGEMFKSAADIDVVKISYKGPPQSLIDLAAGRIQFVCDPLHSTSLPFIESGKLRPIAFTHTTRSEAAPDVPTMAETDTPMTHITWAALFTNKGTPPDVLAKLRTELQASLKAPQVIEQIRQAGFIASDDDHEALSKIHRSEIDQIKKLVETTGFSAQ